MGRWLDLAREQSASERGEDNRDVRDVRTPNVPIVPNVPALPASALMGLNRLSAMPLPRNAPAGSWREVVADALRLRDEGWAASALAMGWSVHQLFGAGEVFKGVAVELRGRPILAVLEDRTAEMPGAHAAFVVDNGGGQRGLINRRPPCDAVLLWELISGGAGR